MRAAIKTFACIALGLASTITLAATPKEDLHEAFVKFLKVHSFDASLTDLKKGEQTATMSFVAPDRYRIRMAAGTTQLIIGSTLYMDINGKMMRLPVPGVEKMIGQYRNEEFLREMEGGISVQALPDETIDGQPTKVYAYTISKPLKAEAKTWISTKTGLPLQTESTGSYMGKTSTTRVRYSHYNDPSITIDLPN